MNKGLGLKGTKIPMNLHPQPALPAHNKGEKLWSRTDTKRHQERADTDQNKEPTSNEKLIYGQEVQD